MTTSSSDVPTPGSRVPFVPRQPSEFTGGTGRDAGSSGHIQEVGTFSFEANRGDAHDHGTLVLP